MKHGLLAEFTQWWCRIRRRAIRFLDPFGARPWVEPPVPIVAERIKLLAGLALNAAQPDPEHRYYGSGHIVRRVAEAAVRDLARSGLGELRDPGFDATDGYSILKAELPADLILIDPFDSFVSDEAPIILPQIAARSADVAIVVFVLIHDPNGADGRRYVAQGATSAPRLDPELPAPPKHGREGRKRTTLLKCCWRRRNSWCNPRR